MPKSTKPGLYHCDGNTHNIVEQDMLTFHEHITITEIHEYTPS